jgi:uncharacterized protein DUF4153
MTNDPAETASTTFPLRAAIGLAQGVALFLLVYAWDAKIWPATSPIVNAPLVTLAFFVPLIVLVGIGNVRARALAIWTAAALALCAGLAAYDIFRDPDAAGTRVIPQAIVWLALAAGLFIAHALIVAGTAERRYLAGYQTDFEVSWKLGVQLALAGAFVGVFWLLLLLGVELFDLINITAPTRLIRHNWFWIPATTLAFACALHVTDARAAIVQGARTLALTLLAWLLPMMTLLALAFVLTLPATGLAPLWNTRHATVILLIASLTLVGLINTAYQDGRRDIASVVRWSAHAAALVLVPLVALAGYALALRVAQYGWTTFRVNAAACVVVAACYAIGYAVAALRWQTRLAGIEATNIATALVTLVVLLALLTPLADPARIAVADQMARLRDGRIAPEKFDYDFLRFKSGRYGLAALNELAAGEPNSIATKRARTQLALKAAQARKDAKATPETRAANITVIQPSGQTMPAAFLAQDWTAARQAWRLPDCLTRGAQCDAILADLDDDGKPEILLFSVPPGVAVAFRAADDGTWSFLGTIANAYCPGAQNALRAGPPRVVAAQFREIDVGNTRLRVETTCTDINPAVKAVPP